MDYGVYKNVDDGLRWSMRMRVTLKLSDTILLLKSYYMHLRESLIVELHVFTTTHVLKITIHFLQYCCLVNFHI